MSAAALARRPPARTSQVRHQPLKILPPRAEHGAVMRFDADVIKAAVPPDATVRPAYLPRADNKKLDAKHDARLDSRFDAKQGQPDQHAPRVDDHLEKELDGEEAARGKGSKNGKDSAPDGTPGDEREPVAPQDKALSAAAGGKMRRGRHESLAPKEDAAAPEIETVPEPNGSAVTLERESLPLPDISLEFDGPLALGIRPARRAGTKPEPPATETSTYHAVFADAAQAAKRLYDALVAETGRTAGMARSAATRRNDSRQADLDAGLSQLDGGLADARSAFNITIDSALALLDARAADARALIRLSARQAKGALNAASRRVHKNIEGPKTMRAATEAAAAGHKATITALGASAKAAMEKLAKTPEEFFPYKSDVMFDVVNEAVVTRTPVRAGRRANAIGKELDAQTKAINFSFDSLPVEFDAAFAKVNSWINNTEKLGPAAVDAARAGALKQLRGMLRKMRGAIRAGRARTEAALIRQHGTARKQLIATHRNRAKGEEAAASKRSERDLLALKALAIAQGKGTKAVVDGIAREKERNEKDFARAVIASARGYAKRVAATDSTQRPRLVAAAAGTVNAMDRQSASMGERLAASAGSMAERFRDASSTAADALFTQANEVSAEFDKLAAPVAKSMSAYLPPVGEAFDKTITLLNDAVEKTNKRVSDYMAGPKEGSGSSGEKPANAKAPPQPPPSMIPNDFIALAKKTTEDPKTDGKIADLKQRADNTIPGKIDSKAAAVWDNISTWGTKTEGVLSALRSITARQGAAIKFQFQKTYHRDLELYIRMELPKTFSAGSTNRLNVEAALNYLNGNNVAGALADLKAAVNYSNEEARVEAIQRSLTPAQWSELNRLHGEEIADVRNDLDGVDQQVFDALQFEGYLYDAGKKNGLDSSSAAGLGIAEADALRLRERMGRDLKTRRDKGADAAADTLAGVARTVGTDVISGGDALGLDERALASDAPRFDDYDSVKERNKQQWERTKVAFDKLEEKSTGAAAPKDAKAGWSIAAFAAKEREFQEFVPDYSERGGHYKTVRDKISGEQTQLIQTIVDYGPDSEETAAARLMVEVKRDGGKPKPERLDMAMHGGALDAREGEDKSKLPEKEKNARIKQDYDRQKRILILYDQLKRGEKLGPQGQSKTEDPKKELADAARAERVRIELQAQIFGQFLGDPTAAQLNMRTLRKPAETWDKEQEARRDDAKAAFDYALKHEDKRAETLKTTFGRMDKGEIDEAVKAWDTDHPGQDPLFKQLNLFGKGSWWTEKLSGDERNDVELAAMGVARNDKERALIARMRAEQQIRDAGWLGKLAGMITGDYDRLIESRDNIERMIGLPHDAFDAMGQVEGLGLFDKNGKYTPPPGGSAAELERAMNLTAITAESYKVMTDRMATAVTTGLMIAAAIITTALTGGAAASIWIPVLVTAGAGLVGIALSSAIKGNRYSRAEMERDLVMTFVQAATAGLGAAAGIAIRGGAPALRAVASRALVSEKVLERFIAVTGRQGLGKVGTFFAEAGVAGVSNSINSAAAAAMDPANRARGESGDKALDDGVRGFFSGTFGAALMKPAARLGGRVAGGYGQRALAAGVSNAGTRAFEIRWERRAETSRATSSAEDADEVKMALVQGVFQGLGEEKAGRRTDARRAARLQQQRAEARATPETPPRQRAPAEATPAAREPVSQPPPEAVPAGRAPMAHEAPTAPAPRLRAPPEPIVLPLPPELADVGAAAKALRPPELPPVAHEAAPPSPKPSTGEAPPELIVPRSRDAEEREPPSSRRTGTDDDRPTIPPVGEKKPIHNLEEGWIDHPDGTREFVHLPEKTVMMDPDPTNHQAAVENYGALIRDRPTHETALYHNPVTGEYIVVQGNRETVFVEGQAGVDAQAPHPEGMAQAWKAILPADKGRWELQAHFHPDYINPNAHPALKRIPSGERGDFGALRAESAAAGNVARSSRIHYLEGGAFKHTDFGFDPGNPNRPYWVEFENPRTGKRDRREFRSMAEFDSWTGRLLKQPAIATPSVPPPPAGTAPVAPSVPKPGAGADDIVLRHGTTRAEADMIRQAGIDPFRKSGTAEDLSRGFYMTLDDPNAQKYAHTRARLHPERGGPAVLEIPVKLSELGTIVDVREGGAHREKWDEFLDRSPPAYPPWGAPYFKNAREFLQGTGKFRMNEIQRGTVFEAFLKEQNLLHADVVRGDLGKGLTTGIAAHAQGEQIAIRSKEAAEYLNAKLQAADVPVPDAASILPKAPRMADVPDAPRPGSGRPQADDALVSTRPAQDADLPPEVSAAKHGMARGDETPARVRDQKDAEIDAAFADMLKPEHLPAPADSLPAPRQRSPLEAIAEAIVERMRQTALVGEIVESVRQKRGDVDTNRLQELLIIGGETMGKLVRSETEGGMARQFNELPVALAKPLNLSAVERARLTDLMERRRATEFPNESQRMRESRVRRQVERWEKQGLSTKDIRAFLVTAQDLQFRRSGGNFGFATPRRALGDAADFALRPVVDGRLRTLEAEIWGARVLRDLIANTREGWLLRFAKDTMPARPGDAWDLVDRWEAYLKAIKDFNRDKQNANQPRRVPTPGGFEVFLHGYASRIQRSSFSEMEAAFGLGYKKASRVFETGAPFDQKLELLKIALDVDPVTHASINDPTRPGTDLVGYRRSDDRIVVSDDKAWIRTLRNMGEIDRVGAFVPGEKQRIENPRAGLIQNLADDAAMLRSAFARQQVEGFSVDPRHLAIPDRLEAASKELAAKFPKGLTLEGKNPLKIKRILEKHGIELVVTSAAGREMDRVSRRLHRAGVRFLRYPTIRIDEEDDDEAE